LESAFIPSLHFHSDEFCELFGGGWTLLSAFQWKENGGALRAVLSHRIRTTTGVSWLLIAEVAADGGESVAFEIEEALDDVEGVRWIQEQAEAGKTVKLRFFNHR